MKVVDTLVTKYTMDDSDYQRGVNSVSNATSQLGGSFAFAGGGAAAMAAQMAAMAAAAAMAGATVASKTAADFEVLERSLDVVTGSAERSAQVFDFVKRQAGPSAFFDTMQLGEAAKLLEAFGLQTERFLPLANTMASVFGQNEESLTGFVNALGRIRGGSFGEGFERLREMGLNRQVLEAQGLKFDKSGQFTGTVNEALTGIEKAIKSKFAGMDAAIGNTFAAQTATAGDMISQAFGQVGEVLNREAIPAIQMFSSEMQNFVAAGAFEDLANSVKDAVSMFDSLGLNAPKNLWDVVSGWFGGGTAAIEARTKEMQNSPAFQKAIGSLNYGTAAFEPMAKPMEEVAVAVNDARGFLASIERNTKESLDLQKIALGAGASAVGVTSVELSDRGKMRGGSNKVARLMQELVGAIAEDAIRLADARDAQRRMVFGR